MEHTDDGATTQAARAHFALVEAIRDNHYLPGWAVDELIDTQPDGTHAKQLLVALALHDLVPRETAGVVMIRDGLGGE